MSKYRKEDLKNRCEKFLLPVSGTKEQLLERLRLYATVSTLSKEKILSKAKKERIELKKNKVMEMRAEYCKKKLGPITPSSPSPFVSQSKTPFSSPSVHITSMIKITSPSPKFKVEIDDLETKKKEWSLEKAEMERRYVFDTSQLESVIKNLKSKLADEEELHRFTVSRLKEELERSKLKDAKIAELEEKIKVKDKVLAETLEEVVKKSKKVGFFKEIIKTFTSFE